MIKPRKLVLRSLPLVGLKTWHLFPNPVFSREVTGVRKVKQKEQKYFPLRCQNCFLRVHRNNLSIFSWKLRKWRSQKLQMKEEKVYILRDWFFHRNILWRILLGPIIPPVRGGPNTKDAPPCKWKLSGQRLTNIHPSRREAPTGIGFLTTKQITPAELLRILLIRAGIETNPGPRWNCCICRKPLNKQGSMRCSKCGKYAHYKCTPFSNASHVS